MNADSLFPLLTSHQYIAPADLACNVQLLFTSRSPN